MSGQVKSCQDRSSHVRTGQVMSGQVKSCQDRSSHVRTGQVMSEQVESSQDRSNHVRTEQIYAGQVMSSWNRSSQVTTGQVKLLQLKSKCKKEEEERNTHLAFSRRNDLTWLNLVCGNCLGRVWWVSGRCLKGVQRESMWCPNGILVS